MSINRRSFLKASGLTAAPLLAPMLPAIAGTARSAPLPPDGKVVNFIFDGEWYSADGYLERLQEINAAQPIGMDVYGNGGAVAALEKKFTEITGKEKALFMPSGTMANQLAIHVLSGDNTKVFVQETSHVYRDEADAAQSVFNKRLIPLATGKTGFTLEELQQGVDYYRKGEVFASGIGVVSIENPVRRTDGRMISIEELRKISVWCRQQGFKLHLDGARLPLAAAWSGIPIKTYASLFDTVYISLYKCLGAGGGAILCGDKSVMDKMTHLVKIHGGSIFRNWTHAAVALYHAEGIEERLAQTHQRSEELVRLLNQQPSIKVTPLQHGTNIYTAQLSGITDAAKLVNTLLKEHNIRIGRPGEAGELRLSMNETILYQDVRQIANAFRKALP